LARFPQEKAGRGWYHRSSFAIIRPRSQLSEIQCKFPTARLSAAVEHSRAIGSAVGLSEWRKREIPRIPRGKSELNEFVARNIGSYWHPVGTCTMGVHEEAVVDPSLRVYGTTNLRVADASIMMTIPSGNTNAPTIVVAERAAQMIKGDK
jgi:choline dehydrogenase